MCAAWADGPMSMQKHVSGTCCFSVCNHCIVTGVGVSKIAVEGKGGISQGHG